MEITYLLGAGASVKALPVVNQINHRLEVFSRETSKSPNIGIPTFFSQHGNEFIDERGGEYKEQIMQELSDSIRWLVEENSKHYSIDTFAKKLYLQKDFTNLHRLKITLCCFFVYEQNKGFDNRYDSFFASILDDLQNLPENLKILSWNYDYQLEIAYSNFIKNNSLLINQKRLNVCSKGIKTPEENSTNRFGIFKLNGTTSLIEQGKNVHILDNVNEEQIKLLNEIVTYYYFSIRHKIPTTLSFAWEIETENYIENVCSCLENTQVLIVIGYSFPFFNRKIDQQILKNMYNLKYIYIQDPNNSEGIEERIKSLLEPSRIESIKFKQITMSDQFYIPFEF